MLPFVLFGNVLFRFYIKWVCVFFLLHSLLLGFVFFALVPFGSVPFGSVSFRFHFILFHFVPFDVVLHVAFQSGAVGRAPEVGRSLRWEPGFAVRGSFAGGGTYAGAAGTAGSGG